MRSLNGRLDQLEALIGDDAGDARCSACQPFEVVRVPIGGLDPAPLPPCQLAYGCAHEPRRLVVRLVPDRGDA